MMKHKITFFLALLFALWSATSFAATIPNLNRLEKPVEEWHLVNTTQLNNSSATLYLGDNYTVTQDPIENVLIIAIQWKEESTSQPKWQSDSSTDGTVRIIRYGQVHYKITPPEKDLKGKYPPLPTLQASRWATPVTIEKNGINQPDTTQISYSYFQWQPVIGNTVLPPLLEWWYKNEILKDQK